MDHPNVPAADSPREPQALAGAECPHCGTMLRRVTAGGDGMVLCLNCGKRHALRPAHAVPGEINSLTSHARETADARLQTREPAAPAYGYLRALGILALVAGVVGSFFACLGIYFEAGHRYFTWNWEVLWLFQNLFTPAIAGWWLFAFTDALVRLDTANTALAWRKGYLTEPIPSPSGSSLPYILPLAASGGALGFAIAFANADSSGDVEIVPLAAGFLLIAASMAAGFAMENLRLFFFRQAEIARMAASAIHGIPLAGRLGAKGWSGPVLWTAGMAVFFPIGMLAILFESRIGGHESLMMFLGICGLAGIGGSLALLLNGLADAREEWLRAARTKPASSPDLLAQVGAAGPLLWICIGAIFSLSLFVSEHRIRMDEFFIFFGFSGGLTCLAMLLSTLFRAVRSWQEAHRKLLGKCVEQSRPYGHVRTLVIVLVLLGAANLFAGAATELKVIASFGRWYRISEMAVVISGIALFVLATAYIPLWLACMVREARLSLQVAEAELARAKAESGASYPPLEN